MQPLSSFQVTGMASEDIFFKRFFDKYGVKAEYEQRYEYKNAVNGYLYERLHPGSPRGRRCRGWARSTAPP
jgi:protease-4